MILPQSFSITGIMDGEKQIFNQTSFTLRDAQIEDASILAKAERSIAQTPGLLVSMPHELTDERYAHVGQWANQKTAPKFGSTGL